MSFLFNFIRFSRVHTVVGTTISILTLYLLALSISDSNQWFVKELLLTLVSCLGANIYIVGLNQITDVEIDRINKPYLPLASGAFSMRLGYLIIFIAVIISLAIAFYIGRYLLLTVLLSLLLGTAYSLPPVRLKRFYFWAAFCIIAVRGLTVNLLLFLNFHFIINGREDIPLIIGLLTGAIFIYSIVIAWFKDMPDITGDRQYQILTLSIKLGIKKVFLLGVFLIVLTLGLLIIFPLIVDLPIHQTGFMISHVILLLIFLWRSKQVALNNQTSLYAYYQFIWLLFFSEYFIFGITGWV